MALMSDVKDQSMEEKSLEAAALDEMLGGIIRDNQEKVVGWMREEPGCWGHLAGKGVAACRQELGRPLTDGERRLVWHRLWRWLEQIKSQALS